MSGPSFEVGPVVSRDRDVHGFRRGRALGPVIEARKQPDKDGKQFVAVRPLYSRIEEPARDRAVSDFFWPWGMVKTRKGEVEWRFLPAFGHDFDADDPGSRHRWTLFPLLFGGENAHGEKYFAIFPVGGAIHEFLGRDRILFVLFPLYAYSEQSDNKTHSVLWPIFSRTRGDDVSRWRAFPFYGVSRNTDRWTKRFVMWPFWTSVQYDYSDQKGGGFILFPLYGQMDVGDRHARMVLPPFFKWEYDAEKLGVLNCPWPFFQYRRGDVNRTYVWPLYGQTAREHERQWFMLWPFVGGRRTEVAEKITQRFRVLPFVFSEKTLRETEAEAAAPECLSRYFKLWPLLSYRREDETSRFRILALWPLKHTPGTERNWAPLWSLYRRDSQGETVESELLWGLYRHRRDTGRRETSLFPLWQMETVEGPPWQRSWSLLYGLLGYAREGLHKQLRMLYFFKLGWQTDVTVGADASREAGDNTKQAAQ